MRKSGKKFVSFVLATAMTLTTFVANTATAMAAELDPMLNSTNAVAIADAVAGADLGSGFTATVDFAVATDGGSTFYGADGTEYTYSKATESNNCIAAQANGDAISFTAPSDGTVKIAFKVSSNKTGTVFGETIDTVTTQESYYGYREHTVTSGTTYTAGVSGSKIRIFYLGFTPAGAATETTTAEATTAAVETTESTTAAVETTQATTAAADVTTEATTAAPAPAAGLDAKLDCDKTVAIAAATAGSDLGNGFTALVDFATATDGAKAFSAADGSELVYSKAEASDNCIAAQANGDAISFTAPEDGTVKIAFKISGNKTGTVFGEAFDTTVTQESAYIYREYPVSKGVSYTAGVSGSKIRIFYLGFSAGSGSSDPTTTATEATTETTTKEAPTQATTAEDANIAAIKGGKTGVVAEVKGAKDNMIDAKAGEYIDVDFVMYNSEGINNLTYFIEYDPSVIILESFNTPAIEEALVYSTKATIPGMGEISIPNYFADPTTLNDPAGNLYQKPSASNSNFADLGADGTKTQPELGRVQDAQMASSGVTLYGTDKADKAILVSGHFKVLGNAGSASPLRFRLVSAADVNVKDIDMLGSTAWINLVDEIPADTTTSESTSETTTATQTTTKDDSETTTKKPDVTTEATTKATTEATTVVEDDTETTTVVEDDTETTTKRKSSGGGGGGGSSSSKASGKESSSDKTKPGNTTDPVEPVEPVEPSKNDKITVVDYSTFVAPNGTVITPPAIADAYGKVYAGSDIPSSVVKSDVFSDTASRAWAESSIEKLATLGIINGVGNGKFAPDNNCKRADFIVMLVKTLGIEGTATDNFDDVVPGKYYSNAVGLAKEVGIATGYGDGNFGPEKTITRQDMMVLVAKTMEFLGEDITADTSVLDQFADAAQMADYAKPYAAYLVSANMVSGTDTGIEPTALMTRAQLAVLVEKLYDAVVELAPAPEAPVEETTVVEEDTEETTESEEDTEETTEAEDVDSEETTEEAEEVEETTEEVTEA